MKLGFVCMACRSLKFMHCVARACVCGGFLGTMRCGCEVGVGCVGVAGLMKMDLVAQKHGGVEAGCARSFWHIYDMTFLSTRASQPGTTDSSGTHVLFRGPLVAGHNRIY